MELRITTLLDIPHEERFIHGSMCLPRPLPGAIRPHPVEPPSVSDDVPVMASSSTRDLESKYHRRAQVQPTLCSTRSGPGAPIAQVLNNEVPLLHTPPPGAPTPISPTAPFSGRLVDLLLDGSEEKTKRREWEQRPIQPALVGGENTVIKLPKLPQLPPKAAKRPRIPPLLQGLHQPPPLPPEGRLFPPITSEKNAFPRSPGERLGYDTYTEEISGRLEDIPARSDTDAMEMTRGSQSDKSTGELHVIPRMSPSTKVAVANETNKASNKRTLSERDGRNKRTKKRNKWSETETKHLLIGVSRFGIGNWKKILQDPEFEFNERTAVDCMEQQIKDHQRELVRRKVPADFTELGIREPFLKSTRRPRRRFSTHDDQNLLVGFERYGPVWHTIRDDTELGFGTRHPTDLRDRFRIRYPEKYAKAGYKLKPKEERIIEDRTNERLRQMHQPHLEYVKDAEQASAENGKELQPGVDTGRVICKGDPIPTTAIFPPMSSTYKSFGMAPYFPDSLPALLDDDAVSDDWEGTKSPITLNRNILQWADANPATSSAIPTPSANTYETSLNIFVTSDGIHIDPLATLQLPMTTSNSNVSPIVNDQSGNTGSGMHQQPTIASGRLNVPGDMRGSSNGTTEATDPKRTFSIGTATVLPRTPNLPTIVFPYVPAASARTTLHNLPTPADLLLGMELGKSEPQSLGILDDTLGLAMP
ncbi:hypothetical protein BKA66DRAFT_442046 [Pyrenochaeta sp. MPI-SDFR-AT-0127]|nr:hypothetical protein BKA66DRAFT_442046 [Pyrenochaeta sp. MPI-SDFR-AT-0127]